MTIVVYKFSDEDGDGTVEQFEYDQLPPVGTRRAAPSTSPSRTASTSSSSSRPTAASTSASTTATRPTSRPGTSSRSPARRQIAPGVDDRRRPDRRRHGRHDAAGRPVDDATRRGLRRRRRRAPSPRDTTDSTGAFRIGADRARQAAVLRLRPDDQEVPGDRVLHRQGRLRDAPTPVAPGSQRRQPSPWLPAARSPVASPATPVHRCTGSRSASRRLQPVCDYTDANGVYIIENVDDRRPRRAASPTRSASTPASTTTTSASTSTTSRSPTRPSSRSAPARP